MLRLEETPETLTSAAVSGDQDALAALLEVHDSDLRKSLDGSINRRYRAAFDVDDVLQVTYLEVFLGIAQFNRNGPGSFFGWLRRIAEHNLHDAIRELKRDKRIPRDKIVDPVISGESYVALITSLGTSGTTPSTFAARKEAKDLLESALRELPPDYETVVRLYDLTGQCISEIARQMNRSPGAVHMLKARAHDRLAKILGRSSRFFTFGA